MFLRPATLIQISDCHLFAHDDLSLMGIKTRQSFADVIAMIRSQESDIDHIVVTGDISQDDSIESYHYCHRVLSSLNTPFSWLRGNHDNMTATAATVYQDNFPSIKKVGNWLMLLLDTHISGKVHGELSPQTLIQLEETLARQQHTPLLIAMHHHPIPIQSLWLDNIRLTNGETVLQLLSAYPQVQAIIHGHTHQQRDSVHHGIRILGTPSTSVQLTPGATEFSADDRQPGYRRLRLHPDGQLDTTVHRLPADTWLPDHSQTGY